jgi:hypothetical protein
MQPRCPRPDQLSPASSAHRGGRAAFSPLLCASARLRRRARDGASAAGLANVSQAWRARARTTRPCAHNVARPHLSPVPVRAQRGTPAPATVRQLMAREQVTTVPSQQARGGHVACAPAAGRVSDPSTEVQTPARDNHCGPGMGHLPFYTHVTGMAHPTAHNEARPHLQRCARAERRADPRKLLAQPPQSQPGSDVDSNGLFLQARAPKVLARSLLSQPWVETRMQYPPAA